MDIDDRAEQHTQLLEAQKKVLANAKRRTGERPRDRKPKGELYNNFMMRLMFSSLKPQQSEKVMIHSSFVPPAYHPCTKPFTNLKSIFIQDLQLETHHRGTYLVLRSMTPPSRMTAVVTVMEDVNGDGVILQLYQQEAEEIRKATDVINVGTIMIVKEPFYKVMGDGEYGLRVDHLSDFVTLHEGDDRIPNAWKPRFLELGLSAESFKSRGNAAMGEGRYWDAIKDYSNALEQPATTNEIEVIKRNRSLAYLRTYQFDAALVDTGFPDFNATTSEKALFRAAEALYYLGKFEKSCEVLQLLCAAYPDNKQAMLSLDRAQNRVREQKTGDYNFNKLQAEAKKLHPPQLDHATYIGPIEVRQTKSKGRGMFVTKVVKAGDLLLCEKAFSTVYDDKKNPKISFLLRPETNRASSGTQADIITLIVHKLHRNPSMASEFAELYHGSYKALDMNSVDSQPIVDTFLVDAIVSLNVFGCPHSTLASHKSLLTRNRVDKGESCGVWIQASYINHSCTGTARRSFIGDMMIVRATRDMEPGTEITFPYHPPDTTVADMAKKLSNWGFICNCVICKDGRVTSATVMTERKKLLEQAKHLLETPGAAKMGRIERALEAVEKTYSKPAIEVPRVQLWDLSLSLAQEFADQSKAAKCLHWLAKVLDSLGFVVTGTEPSPGSLVVVQWGMVVDDLVWVFMNACDAFRAVGAWEKSRQAKDYARVVFKIVVGEDGAFADTYDPSM